MPHGLVHESEEKLRAHFFHTGTPSATGLLTETRWISEQMVGRWLTDWLDVAAEAASSTWTSSLCCAKYRRRSASANSVLTALPARSVAPVLSHWYTTSAHSCTTKNVGLTNTHTHLELLCCRWMMIQHTHCFFYFIHQSTSIKHFTVSQEKHNLKTVWIKCPTQGRATYV